MDSLPDYEIRAAEADRLAEAAKNVALAQEWRDIAEGYRLLAGLVAARPEAEPTDGAADRFFRLALAPRAVVARASRLVVAIRPACTQPLVGACHGIV